MNMQAAEYYAFNQGPPQPQMQVGPPQMQMPTAAAYSYGGFMPFTGYPIGQTLPTHKHLEKLKRNKNKTSSGGDIVGRSGSGANKFVEEVTNSTDESIHLVRSRKTGGIKEFSIFYMPTHCQHFSTIAI